MHREVAVFAIAWGKTNRWEESGKARHGVKGKGEGKETDKERKKTRKRLRKAR